MRNGQRHTGWRLRCGVPAAVSCGHLVVGQGDLSRADVLLQVGDLRRTGNGHDHLRTREQPRERDLSGCAVRGAQQVIEAVLRGCQASATYRIPRNEPDAIRRAVLDDGLRPSVGEVVEVLHRGYRSDRPSLFDLGDPDLAQTNGLDLALVPELDESTERIHERDLLIDAMQLKQRNAVQPKPAQ